MSDSTRFDLTSWQSSLLFPNAGGMQTCSTGGKISKHLLRHWFKCIVGRCGLKHSTNFAEVGLITTGKRQHQVTQNLLRDVENVELGLSHGNSLVEKPNS